MKVSGERVAAANHEYAGPERLGRLTRWSLRALVVANAVFIVSSAAEYQLLVRIRDHGAFSGMIEAAQASDLRQQTVSIVQVFVFLVSGVLTLRWIWRSNKNLHASGAQMEYTPGWAVGWYFIPFANLVKPYQAMREIWRLSLSTDTSGPLPWWWACWLIGNIAGNISFRLSLSEDIATLIASNIAGIVSAAFEVATAAVLIQMVGRVTSAQRSLPSVTETFS